MILKSIYNPWPKQALFHQSTAYETMFGGHKGPGKTHALVFDPIITQAMEADVEYLRTGVKSTGWALIARKSFNRLKELIARANSAYEKVDPDSHWVGGDHLRIFNSGYRIEFGHLEGPYDFENYQGRPLTYFGLDQGEEVPKNDYDYIKAQLRSGDPLFPPEKWRVVVMANPLGTHAQWVKERFVTPNRAGMQFIPTTYKVEGQDITRYRVYIPAKLDDNPSMPLEYRASLMDLPDHMRRAYLEGDWDVVVGSYFGDLWDRSVHVLPYDFKPADHSPIYMGGDWGTRAPACTLWGCVDNDGRLIILDELYHPASTGTEWGLEMLQLMRHRGYDKTKVWGWLDAGARADYGADGPSPWEAMWNLGIQWDDADKRSRVAGWTEVRERLRKRHDGKPSLYIRENCENLLRELPNITADDKKPDDVDSSQSDHACDALRYLCMGRPMGSTPKQKEDRDLAEWHKILEKQKAHREGGFES